MYRLKDIVGDWEEPDVYAHEFPTKLPIISPTPSEWNTQQDPPRLSRMFKFQNEENMNAFILDVLEHQAETGHHGRLTIQHPQVKIEVWTHTLNDVTEVDAEWAEVVSQIFEGYNE